jgi:hypothetical protein
MIGALAKYGNSVLTVVMLAIFTTAVTLASGYPEGARFMPFIVGIPGIALCLVQLVLDARERRLGTAAEDDAGDFQKAEARISRMAGRPVDFEIAHQTLPGAADGGQTSAGRELAMWAYFLGLIGGVLVFGFWVTIPVFLVVFLRFQAQARWRTALLLGLGGGLILFAVFEKGLRVSLHRGFIPPEELAERIERAVAFLRALLG